MSEQSAENGAGAEHDGWCDANGCRCGKCPCLGPPWCAIPPAVQWGNPPHAEAARKEGDRIYEGEPGYVIPPGAD